MGRKCFISFKTVDIKYKKHIHEELNVDMIDKSLNQAIDSKDEDYIMQKIREDYLSDSTVTIHLIGAKSAETLGYEEQKYIKREMQASLFNGKGNTRNGILGVVLPNVYESIYIGSHACKTCGGTHDVVAINDYTTIKEFSVNYYIPEKNKCSWAEEDRYCVLVKWDNFCIDPEKYIEEAFKKRTQAIADKVTVYPK